jgi:hypothetical protein
LSSAFVRGLRGLVEDDPFTNRGRLLDRYADLGFNLAYLEPLEAQLPALTEALLEPFRSAGSFDANAWDISGIFERTLGPLRYNFRFAGPPGMIHFVRVFKGLIQYLRALNVPAPLGEAYREATAGASLAESPHPVPMEPEGPALSRRLKVEVKERGERKVLLSFPSALLPELRSVMPEDLQERIARRAVDVDAICAKALAQGSPPGGLFSFEDGPKSVAVWLE